jgi:membrane-associated phospholipid phosphatase
MKRFAVLAIAFAVASPAATAKTTETLGTGFAIALPVVAAGITVWKDDWVGTEQLAISTLLTVGTVYGLKHLVRECRPFAVPCAHGSSNWDSFPSEHSALAFAPAEFLRERYGWRYGLPAYAAAGFVGWSRVDAQKHHWYDVAASFGISLLFNELITTRYHKPDNLHADLQAKPNAVYASLNYTF